MEYTLYPLSDHGTDRMFFPFNGSLSSRFFWLAVSIVAVFLSCGYAWNRFRPEIVSQHQYQLGAETLDASEQPEFLTVDVRGEVLTQLQTSHVSLLDHDVLQRVAKTFLDHRCVAGVYSVSKTMDRVHCSLEYRTADAAIESIDRGNRRQLFPIGSTQPDSAVESPTGSVSVLNSEDFVPEYVDGLIQISAPDVDRKAVAVGEILQNESVLQAAAIARAINSQQEIKAVVRIQKVGSGRSSEFHLHLQNGSRVIWGDAPGAASNGEATIQEKLAALREVVSSLATQEDAADFQDIDIRSGKPRRVIPHTAQNPQG